MKTPIHPRLYSDTTNKLIYFHAPKCASRTIIAWYGLINYPNMMTDHPSWFDSYRKGDYMDIYEFVNKPKFENIFKLPKFCVVRNPIERFVSAFTDRVLRYQLNEFEEIKTIDNFIDNFDFYMKKYDVLSHHIKPQYIFYGENVNEYDHIFKMSEIDEIKKLLEDTYQVVLPDLHLQQCKHIEKPRLNENQIKFLENFYKKDYELFDSFID
jgi:hypothetical protein